MKNILSIVRGDTQALELEITDNNTPTTVDSIYFTVKNDTNTDEVLFQKKLNDGISLTDNIYNIIIDPSDTDELDYGRYAYDIEIIKNSVKKTILVGILEISEEVTFTNNEA
ncbi:MAG: hypothetical protein ACI4VE_05555 [Clostridia bacterium]